MSTHETLDREEVAALLPPGLAQCLRGRPSLRTRQEALRRVLVLRPWRSDRLIASWCNVSRELVAKTRARLLASGEIRRQPDRIGGDGKRYHFDPKPERTIS